MPDNIGALAGLISKYYDVRRLVMPNTDQAFLWIVSEVGEVADMLNMRTSDWVRNNPDKHEAYSPGKFAEELGDIVFMCMVAGMTVGVDPLDAMLKKMGRKLKELNGPDSSLIGLYYMDTSPGKEPE